MGGLVGAVAGALAGAAGSAVGSYRNGDPAAQAAANFLGAAVTGALVGSGVAGLVGAASAAARSAFAQNAISFGVSAFTTAYAEKRIEKHGIQGLLECFPGDAPILMADGGVKPIRDILPGDEVFAFDGAAEVGRGALVPRKVVRLFRNVTDEWIVVEAAAQDRAAAARNGFDQITITPGHAVLNEHGAFEKIGDLTARGGRIH